MDEILLTPGPLTTSKRVKDAMNKDLGSRDDKFIEITAKVRKDLVDLVNGGQEYTCVPMQGSGTFSVEAVLSSVIPRGSDPKSGKVLIFSNGEYGRRMHKICCVQEIWHELFDTSEKEPIKPSVLEMCLDPRSSEGPLDLFTHVAVVHCETTTGILNPVEKLGAVAQRYGKTFIVDAMSSYAGIPIDVKGSGIDYLIASSNKGLQGLPGVGFAICNRENLLNSAGNARTLSLDLVGQYQGFEKNGQWRFTPPIQVLLAMNEAVEELKDEGGVIARNRRYTENQQRLSARMKDLGFKTYLHESVQSPIITTFYLPPEYDFNQLYNALKFNGFVIYPGKLTQEETFRVGSIGAIDVNDINRFCDVMEQVVKRREALK